MSILAYLVWHGIIWAFQVRYISFRIFCLVSRIFSSRHQCWESIQRPTCSFDAWGRGPPCCVCNFASLLSSFYWSVGRGEWQRYEKRVQIMLVSNHVTQGKTNVPFFFGPGPILRQECWYSTEVMKLRLVMGKERRDRTPFKPSRLTVNASSCVLRSKCAILILCFGGTSITLVRESSFFKECFPV